MLPISESILIHRMNFTPSRSAFRSKGVKPFYSKGHLVKHIVKQSIGTDWTENQMVLTNPWTQIQFKCKHVRNDLLQVWNFQGQSMTCDMRKKLKCRLVNNFWHWKLWSILSIRKNFQNTCIYFKNKRFKGVGILTVMSKLSKWAWTTPLCK